MSPRSSSPCSPFDQTVNAERVAAAGAGIHLLGGPSSVAEFPSALRDVLTNPAYRAAAQAVAADMAAVPDVVESVLEKIARPGR